MARSAGRIGMALSILLMGLGGFWATAGAIPTQSDEAYLAQFDAQVGTAMMMSAVPVSPESVQEVRGLLVKSLLLWRELWAMPSIKVTVWLSLVLHAAATAAGIGWLFGWSWAIPLGFWQAVGFVPFAVWSWWPLDRIMTRARDVLLASSDGAPTIAQLRTWFTGAQAAMLWTNTLMLVGWNLFLVWYFFREQRRRAAAVAPGAGTV